MGLEASVEDVNRSGGRQLADVLGTIALLIAHFVLSAATFLVISLLVMTTDSCSVQKCGDRAWLDRAFLFAVWAGGAFLFLDVLVTVIRLVRRRVAWVVPLLGCVAQLAVALGAAAMALQAGPV
jgi:hypothetical protein